MNREQSRRLAFGLLVAALLLAGLLSIALGVVCLSGLRGGAGDLDASAALSRTGTLAAMLTGTLLLVALDRLHVVTRRRSRRSAVNR